MKKYDEVFFLRISILVRCIHVQVQIYDVTVLK